jgi:hypothetical protein
MRLFVLAAAGLLLAPGAVSAKTFTGPSFTTKSIEFSAAKKKKEKVEYMRSAAGPEPVAKKTKKNKKKKKK